MRIPQTAPDWRQVLYAGPDASVEAFHSLFRPEVEEFVRRANDRYYHWDKLRHQPLPAHLKAELAWAAVQMSRSPHMQRLPLTFRGQRKLRYWLPPQHQEWLCLIDQKAGGNIGSRSPFGALDDNERYLFNSLMEEAIASSQLEGAITTREVAKEMIRTHRQPRDRAEQMIVNNYKAILEIRDIKNDKLTPALLCHLQQVLTDKTLDDPTAAGRFRLPGEQIHVVDATTGDVLYEPPHANLIEKRIQEVRDFANEKSVPFVHPVVKAMALHFAIGFIHPFKDGNGRTARAIFYWHMLKSDYWFFEYLPISRIIQDSPIKYARSYLYSETDEGDLTYFNQYHLNVIIRALDELHGYIDDQMKQRDEAKRLLEDFPQLNHRQRSLVYNAIKHPGESYTIQEHEGKYCVTYNTARADLLTLEEIGLVEKVKRKGGGKGWVFRPAKDLMKRLHLSGKAGEQFEVKKKKSREPLAVTATEGGEERAKTRFDGLPDSPAEPDESVD